MVGAWVGRSGDEERRSWMVLVSVGMRGGWGVGGEKRLSELVEEERCWSRGKGKDELGGKDGDRLREY